MTVKDEKSACYWKARAEALETINRRLFERLRTFASILPPDYLDVVEGLGEAPSRAAGDPVNLTAGGSEMIPSDVETDLARLWERTAPRKSG